MADERQQAGLLLACMQFQQMQDDADAMHLVQERRLSSVLSGRHLPFPAFIPSPPFFTERSGQEQTNIYRIYTFIGCTNKRLYITINPVWMPWRHRKSVAQAVLTPLKRIACSRSPKERLRKAMCCNGSSVATHLSLRERRDISVFKEISD